MSPTEETEGCAANGTTQLARAQKSAAMPRHLFPVAVGYLVILLAAFVLYFVLPWYRAHVPGTLGPIPSGVVWFGATGAEMASLYGIFVHNSGWNSSYNYWHLCRPLFGAVSGSVGALFYLVLLHLGGTSVGKVDALTFYAVAFVLGFADKAFMQLLQTVTTVIVKPGNQATRSTQPLPPCTTPCPTSCQAADSTHAESATADGDPAPRSDPSDTDPVA